MPLHDLQINILINVNVKFMKLMLVLHLMCMLAYACVSVLCVATEPIQSLWRVNFPVWKRSGCGKVIEGEKESGS